MLIRTIGTLCMGALLAPAALGQATVLNEGFEGYSTNFILSNSAFSPWIYYAYNISGHRAKIMHRDDADPLYRFPVANEDPDSWNGAPNDRYIKLYGNPGAVPSPGSVGHDGYHRGVYRQLPTAVQPGTYAISLRTNVHYPGAGGEGMYVRTKVVFGDMTASAFWMANDYANDPSAIPGSETFALESKAVNNATPECNWTRLYAQVTLTGAHEAVYIDVEFRELNGSTQSMRYRIDDIVITEVPPAAPLQQGQPVPQGGAKVMNDDAPSVRPNPSNGLFRVTTGLADGATGELVVSDAQGREMLRTMVQGNYYDVDLSGRVSGIYLLLISSAEGEHRARLLKE